MFCWPSVHGQNRAYATCKWWLAHMCAWQPLQSRLQHVNHCGASNGIGNRSLTIASTVHRPQAVPAASCGICTTQDCRNMCYACCRHSIFRMAVVWLSYCSVGSARQVSLVGHSAGAQLYMMALLQRAKAIHEILHSSQQPPATVTSKHQIDLPAMPKQFVAITGVYDIAKHYAYEEQRGVHELSTMKRAMGGFEGFAAMSPAVILGAALQPQYVSDKQQPHVHVQQEAEHHSSSNVQQQQQRQELTAVNINNSFQLSGESIARRIGACYTINLLMKRLRLSTVAQCSPVWITWPLHTCRHLDLT